MTALEENRGFPAPRTPATLRDYAAAYARAGITRRPDRFKKIDHLAFCTSHHRTLCPAFETKCPVCAGANCPERIVMLRERMDAGDGWLRTTIVFTPGALRSLLLSNGIDAPDEPETRWTVFFKLSDPANASVEAAQWRVDRLESARAAWDPRVVSASWSAYQGKIEGPSETTPDDHGFQGSLRRSFRRNLMRVKGEGVCSESEKGACASYEAAAEFARLTVAFLEAAREMDDRETYREATRVEALFESAPTKKTRRDMLEDRAWARDAARLIEARRDPGWCDAHRWSPARQQQGAAKKRLKSAPRWGAFFSEAPDEVAEDLRALGFDASAVGPATRAACLAQIKATYRRLALQCHPDKVGGRSEDFIKISTAHERLVTRLD